MPDRGQVDWAKFFADDRMDWDEKAAIYPTLANMDERLASAPDSVRNGFFGKYMSQGIRREETEQIEQTGWNLQAAFPNTTIGGPGAGVGILSELGKVIQGAAPQLQRGRQYAAAADSVADQYGGLPSAVTSMGLTAGDTAYEMARRLPKAAGDVAAQLVTGTGTNLNTFQRLAAARRGGFEDTPGIGDKLIEAGTDQESRLPMPRQMEGVGWIPEMAGEITAQVPILSAIGLGNVTGGPAGGLLASQTLLSGQVAERMAEETGEVSAPMASTLGALGAIPEQITFLKALKKVKGSASPGYLRRVFNAGVGEGATEALQQELERLGVHWLDPNFEVFSREGLSEMAYGAKQGVLLGWLMGSVGSLADADPDAVAWERAEELKRREGLRQPQSRFGEVETIDESIVGLPQPVRFTEAQVREGAFKDLKEGYARVDKTKDGRYHVQMFDDFDQVVRDVKTDSLQYANDVVSQGIGRVVSPALRRVKEDYSGQSRDNVAASVKPVTVDDPQINYMIDLAREEGIDVNLYTDIAEDDFIRAISNEDGSVAVRFDPRQPEATSATIARALFTQKLKTDPAVAMRTAEELQRTNPTLWEAAERTAESKDPISITAKAADLSFRDVITAMEHPLEVSKAAQRTTNFVVKKLAGAEAKLSSTMRAALNHIGLDFALPQARTGGLLTALRDQPGYMRLVQDIEGTQTVAGSAEVLGDVMQNVMASQFDPLQPLIIRGGSEDRTGADLDIDARTIESRSRIYNLLNRLVYPNMGIEEIEKRIKEAGGVIDDTVASADERDVRNSKTYAFVKKNIEDYYKPMTDILKADPEFDNNSEADRDLFDRFLKAWTAEERNRVLRERNPGSPSLHSGLSDQSIEEIYREAMQRGLTDTFKRAATYLAEIHNRVLDLAISEGVVVNRDEVNKMRARYKRYLPLRLPDVAVADDVDAWMDEIMGIDPTAVEANQGISRELFHEIEGRREEGIAPVVQETMHQLVYRTQEIRRQASIRKLANLAMRYPSELIRVVNRKPMKTAADRARPTEVGFRENGEDKAIVLKAGMGLHTGLVEISPRKRDIFGKFLQKTTRFMSQLATTMSPAFWFANLPRDLLTAGIQTDSAITPEEIYANMPKVTANLMFSAMGEDPKVGGKLYDEETAKYIEEAEAHGMMMSIMGLREIQDITDRMLKDVDFDRMMLRSPMAPLRWFVSFMENASGVIENSTRLGAYIAARKAGYSADQAAVFGRRLTVDFGRRTEWSSSANDYYMFFNAGIQGTSRIFETAWRNKEGRARMMKLVGMAAVLALYNEMFAGDDEDTGENNWVKMQDSFDKLSHFIIMKPDFSGEYWKIPVPPGFSFLSNFGYKLNDWSRGRMRDPFDELLEISTTALEEFSPLSGSRIRTSGYLPVGRHADWHQVGSWVLPDPLKPIIDVMANKNQWGSPVRPERYGKGDVRPDSELYFKNVSPVIKFVTDQMNKFGAGSETYPGSLFGVDTSYSPENLEHLLTGYTTGLGQSFLRGTKLSGKMLMGEEIYPQDIPIFRRFQGEPSDFNIRDEYYAIMSDLKAHEATWKAYLKDPDSVPLEDFDKRYGWKNRFVPLLNRTEKTLNKIDDPDVKLEAMKEFVISYQKASPG
jgi:hypothetical protein